MKRLCNMTNFAAIVLTMVASNAEAQAIQSPAVLINKLSSRYRSIQTYNDTASWKIRIGERDILANITLAAAQPNKYLLEIKGERANTLVWSDGNILSGYLADKNTLARTKAPVRLFGADVLNGLDLQFLGVRLITLLLQGNVREADSDIAAALAHSKLTGPQVFSGRQAYVLSFPWEYDYEARVYVSADDSLIRRVTLLKNGVVEWVENHESIQIDRPVAIDTFNRTSPEGAKIVASLMPLDKLTTESAGTLAPDFAIDSIDGQKVRLSELKGKVVLINFYTLDDEKLDENFPHLVQIAKDFKSKGLEVISINESNQPNDEIAAFFKKKQATHISALNNPTDAVKLYKVAPGSQASLVINREGNLVARFTGYFLPTIKNNLRKAGLE